MLKKNLSRLKEEFSEERERIKKIIEDNLFERTEKDKKQI
jgi:hypothetical protein